MNMLQYLETKWQSWNTAQRIVAIVAVLLAIILVFIIFARAKQTAKGNTTVSSPNSPSTVLGLPTTGSVANGLPSSDTNAINNSTATPSQVNTGIDTSTNTLLNNIQSLISNLNDSIKNLVTNNQSTTQTSNTNNSNNTSSTSSTSTQPTPVTPPNDITTPIPNELPNHYNSWQNDHPSGFANVPPKTYTVKTGDWLSKITPQLNKQYGTSFTWQDLYNANKNVIGSNPNLIKPGQVLTIPGT